MADYPEDSTSCGARLQLSRTAEKRQRNPEAKRKPEADAPPVNAIGYVGAALPALAQPGVLSPSLARDSLFRLQRSHGNQYVRRMLQRSGDTGGEVTPDLEGAIDARGGGHPLDRGVQSRMGRALDADFSGVRVHTDSEADGLNRSLQARAFTTGKDVYFRHGEYNPGTSSGRQLLAHELTHVVQQGGSTVQSKSQEGDRDTGCSSCAATSLMRTLQAKLTVGAPNDIYEQEADDFANAYANWERQPSTKGNAGSPLQRQEAEEEKKEEMMQTKPDSSRLFRQVTEEKEEEPVQAKLDGNTLQRQREEEEELQPRISSGELRRLRVPAEELFTRSRPEIVSGQKGPEGEELLDRAHPETLGRQQAPKDEDESVSAKAMSLETPQRFLRGRTRTARKSEGGLDTMSRRPFVPRGSAIFGLETQLVQRDLRSDYQNQWGPAQTQLNAMYAGVGGVIDRQKGAVADFQRYARTPDQPSLGEQVLTNGINIVLGAVIPGVGGFIKTVAQSKVRESLRGAVGSVVDSMVDAGKGAAQGAVTSAWSQAAGGDTPIIQFAETQRRALELIAQRQVASMNRELAGLLATAGDTDEWEAGGALYQSFQQSLDRAYNQQFNKMTDTWFAMQTRTIGGGARPGVLRVTLERRYPHQGSFRIRSSNLLGSGSVTEIRSRLARRTLRDIAIPKFIKMNGQMGWGIADCNWSITVTGAEPPSEYPTISAPQTGLERLTAGPQRVSGYGGHRRWGWPWLAAYHLGLDDLDNDDPRNTDANRSSGAREIWETIRDLTPGSIEASTW